MHLLSSKHDNDILLTSSVPILCFFTLNYFHFVPDYFFIKQNIFIIIKLNWNIYSLCCVNFCIIIRWSCNIIQYIFGFNPINLLIGITLNWSFIFSITLLLVRSKKSDWNSLNSNKCLYLKILHKHLLTWFHK